jgi:hypothetical protein
MKKVYSALLIGLFFHILSVNAQTQPGTSMTTEAAERLARDRQAARAEADRLQNLIKTAGSQSAPNQSQWMRYEKGFSPLYRKPTEEELKALMPRAEDTKKYAEFLRQSDTGIIKLAADANCGENIRVIFATPKCLQYTMPGAGNSFSFRTENYRIRRLADIIYTSNSFQSAGILMHGIFVEIGNVPLENVNLQTAGLGFLTNFQPEPDPEKWQEINRKLSEGVIGDGFLYRRGVRAAENTTYVLRSVAYNGIVPRAARGMSYNEMDFDKRRDIIVAFRIVRKDPDGSVTILWKELLRKKSPKIIRKNNSKKNNLAGRNS